MKKAQLKLAILLLVWVVPIFGCTTATYGVKPTPVAGQQDTFTFKIYTGGFAAGGTADKRASEEFDQCKTANGYSSYTILNKRYEFVPSGFVYTVQFFR